jgi:transcriptional regulator NrdR family protein
MFLNAQSYAACGNSRAAAREAEVDAVRQSRRGCNSSAGRYSQFAEAFRRANLPVRKRLDARESFISAPPDDSILRAGKQTTHTVDRSHVEGPSHRFGSLKCRRQPGEHPERL